MGAYHTAPYRIGNVVVRFLVLVLQTLVEKVTGECLVTMYFVSPFARHVDMIHMYTILICDKSTTEYKLISDKLVVSVTHYRNNVFEIYGSAAQARA